MKNNISYKIRYILAVVSFVLGVNMFATANAGTQVEGDVGRGATAWVDNCSRCHNMREPGEFSDALWKPIVTHMRVRAGLTGQEARDILKFLQSSN